VSPEVGLQEDMHRAWSLETDLEGKQKVDIVLGREVRCGLLAFGIWKLIGNIFVYPCRDRKW